MLHRYWPICWQKLQIIVYHLIDFPLGSELPPNVLSTLEFGIWVHLRSVAKFYCPQTASHMEEPELLAWECVKCRTPMFVSVSKRICLNKNHWRFKLCFVAMFYLVVFISYCKANVKRHCRKEVGAGTNIFTELCVI